MLSRRRSRFVRANPLQRREAARVMDATRAPPAGSGDPPTAGELRESTADECVQLLRRAHVGRVAVATPSGWPLIRPVDYVFDDRSRSVVFRSRRGSKLYALSHSQRASCEIDSAADPAASWSVIVTGVVETVTHPPEIARLERLGLNTRVAVEPSTWLRIRPNVMSGRRID